MIFHALISELVKSIIEAAVLEAKSLVVMDSFGSSLADMRYSRSP